VNAAALPPDPPLQLPEHVPVDFSRPTMAQFVLLSMMLHVLAVLLFGAPSGGSREGRALWGSLSVVINNAIESRPNLKLDRGLGNALPGLPAQRKAAVPAAPPVAQPPEAAVKKEPAAPPPVEASPPRLEPDPAPAPPPETFVVPPLMDKLVVPDRRELLHAPKELPPPVEKAVEAPPKPKAEPRPVVKEQPVETPPLPTPAVPAPPPVPMPAAPSALELPTAPRVERVPVEAPPVAAPLAEPKPPPVVEPKPAPVIERTPAPPTPVESAPAPTPTPAPAPAPTPEAVTPKAPVVEAPLAPQPAVQQPAVQQPAVQQPPAVTTQPPTTQTPAAQPPATQAPASQAPAIERPLPRVQDAPVGRPSASPFRAPPVDDPFSGKQAPPSTYDPTAPSIDMDAMKKRAGQLAREGTGNRAILPFPMPPGEERKTKEQIAIENARKPDCNKAYQGLGLLAVIPLVANEFGEGTCRWR
jgi:hypothetical protein